MDDPVEANRSANPRRTPGRPEVSAGVLRPVFLVTVGAVVLASVVLAVVLAQS